MASTFRSTVTILCAKVVMALLLSAVSRAGGDEPVTPGSNATADARLAAAFAKRGSWSFDEVPLEDVVRFLAQEQRLVIELDRRALADAGIATDTPLTLTVRDVCFRSCLDLIRQRLGLAWTVKEGEIWITSVEASQSELSTHVYPLADLLRRMEAKSVAASRLLDAITATVEPETWSEVGGPASLSLVGSSLVVSHASAGHDSMRALCDMLRKATAVPTEAVSSQPWLSDEESGVARKALEQRVTLDVTDLPLQELLELLQDRANIPIQPDVKQLEESGIGLDTPITLRIEAQPLRRVFERLRREGELTYTVRRDYLEVVPVQAPRDKIAIYRMANLSSAPDDVDEGFDSLVTAIQNTIDPPSWSEVGGSGAIAWIGGLDLLIVRQVEENHLRIAALLQDLQAVPRGVDRLADPLPTRVYYLGGQADPAKLMDLVCKLVQPAAWAQPEVVIEAIGQQLVVRQTPEMQRRVEKFLGEFLNPHIPERPRTSKYSGMVPEAGWGPETFGIPGGMPGGRGGGGLF